MKKDILKEFVDENRDQFDDQWPGAEILDKLHSRLGFHPTVTPAKPAKLIRIRYWWVAAAVIIATTGIGILLQQSQAPEPAIAHTTNPQTPTFPAPADKAISMSDSPTARVAGTTQKKQQSFTAQGVRTASAFQPANNGTAPNTPPTPAADNWQAGLQNESSSVRLAAVLASGKSKTLTDDDLKSLYFTLNNDNNSNVRLAALEVLQKREQARNLILAAVDKQDDPVVQMELLSSLSPAQAVKVEQQLLDITQNPLTIDAVRNEAYAVLLRSNTHF